MSLVVAYHSIFPYEPLKSYEKLDRLLAEADVSISCLGNRNVEVRHYSGTVSLRMFGDAIEYLPQINPEYSEEERVIGLRIQKNFLKLHIKSNSQIAEIPEITKLIQQIFHTITFGIFSDGGIDNSVFYHPFDYCTKNQYIKMYGQEPDIKTVAGKGGFYDRPIDIWCTKEYQDGALKWEKRLE